MPSYFLAYPEKSKSIILILYGERLLIAECFPYFTIGDEWGSKGFIRTAREKR